MGHFLDRAKSALSVLRQPSSFEGRHPQCPEAQELIAEAFVLADKVNDALGYTDPLTREINRISWAVQDLQDAGEPEEAWRPLLEEEYRLHRQWEARHGGAKPGGARDDSPVP